MKAMGDDLKIRPDGDLVLRQDLEGIDGMPSTKHGTRPNWLSTNCSITCRG